jgi:TPR repeat protein
VPLLDPEILPETLELTAAAEKLTASAARGEISADELRSSMEFASKLIAQADISAARLVLERAASSGDTRAIFALAETYDPNMLSAWRVHGIKGDRDRANALYAEALAKGENEARSRIFALR